MRGEQVTVLGRFLADSVVRIEARAPTGSPEVGTGFLVAPGLVLTCEHVVPEGTTISVYWRGVKYTGTSVRASVRHTQLDLALLQLSTTDHPRVVFDDHPCVLLDDHDAEVNDELFGYGFPKKDAGERHQGGDPLTFQVEGIEGGDTGLLKLKGAKVVKGHSGAPLLNQRTGKVCGILRLTRDITGRSDMGGLAVPVSSIVARYPQLVVEQAAYHEAEPSWIDVLTPTQTGQVALATFEVSHNALLYAIALDPNGTRLATAGFARVGHDGLLLWALDSPGERAKLLHRWRRPSPAIRLAFSPDRSTLACVSETGEGVVVEAGTGREVMTLAWSSTPNAPLYMRASALAKTALSLAYSRDGSVIAAGRADNLVEVWSIEGRKSVTQLPGGRTGPLRAQLAVLGVTGATALAFDPSGHRIAIGYGTKSVSVRELSGPEEAQMELLSPITAVCWHPSGAFLFAGGVNGEWAIWNLAAGGDVVATGALTGRIWCAGFSPGGSHVAIGGDVESILIQWLTGAHADVASPRSVHAVAFNPYGRCVLAGPRYGLSAFKAMRAVRRLPIPLMAGPVEVKEVALPT